MKLTIIKLSVTGGIDPKNDLFCIYQSTFLTKCKPFIPSRVNVLYLCCADKVMIFDVFMSNIGLLIL